MYVKSLSQTKYFCFAYLNIICIFCNWLNLVRQIDWHDGYYRLPRNDALGLWKGNITISNGSLLSTDQESRSLTLHFSSGWRPTPSCCLMWSQWSSANSLSAIWTTLARLWMNTVPISWQREFFPTVILPPLIHLSRLPEYGATGQILARETTMGHKYAMSSIAWP